jgi:Tol biopolymer transport system component
MSSLRSHRWPVAGLALFAVSLVACGGEDDEAATPTGGPGTQPAATTGGAGTQPAATTGGASTDPPALEGTILFGRYGGEYGNETLFIANADGSDERRLVEHESCCPWVSNDGRYAAVNTDRFETPEVPRATVEIVNLDGSGSTVLDPPGETLELLPGPFSPDGTQIAFDGFDETDESRSGTYVGSWSDPSGLVQITTGPTEETGWAMDWSPDGDHLLLYHGRWLAVADVDGTDSRRITPDDVAVSCCARWSPDGSSVLFTDIKGRVLTVSPDGSDVSEVFAPDGSWAYAADWSPDGSQIMFIVNSSPNPETAIPNEIWVINADGSDPRPVIVTDDHKDALWWFPSVEPAD